jgi:hypothetical protein
MIKIPPHAIMISFGKYLRVVLLKVIWKQGRLSFFDLFSKEDSRNNLRLMG